jgi:hypothetical protein
LFAIENSRRDPIPASSIHAMFSVRSGRLAMNQSIRRLNGPIWFSNDELMVRTAKSGISPTIDRTRIGIRSPLDRCSTS